MRITRIVCSAVLLLLLARSCFAHHMAVVVNKSNKVQDISAARLARLVKLETRKWPDGSGVVLVLHKSSSDELITLEHLNKMTEQEFRSFVSAHNAAIKMADSDLDVIDVVSSTPGAVGFVSEHSINDRISVVKVDGKLPLEEGYLPH